MSHYTYTTFTEYNSHLRVIFNGSLTVIYNTYTEYEYTLHSAQIKCYVHRIFYYAIIHTENVNRKYSRGNRELSLKYLHARAREPHSEEGILF